MDGAAGSGGQGRRGCCLQLGDTDDSNPLALRVIVKLRLHHALHHLLPQRTVLMELGTPEEADVRPVLQVEEQDGDVG